MGKLWPSESAQAARHEQVVCLRCLEIDLEHITLDVFTVRYRRRFTVVKFPTIKVHSPDVSPSYLFRADFQRPTWRFLCKTSFYDQTKHTSNEWFKIKKRDIKNAVFLMNNKLHDISLLARNKYVWSKAACLIRRKPVAASDEYKLKRSFPNKQTNTQTLGTIYQSKNC